MKAFPERVVRCAVVLPLLLVACARQPDAVLAADAEALAESVAVPAAPVPAAPQMQLAKTEARSVADTAPSVVSADQLASSANTYTDGQRRFVRTANARFRVRDTYIASLAIEDLVAQQRGFVVLNDINVQVLDTQQRSIGHQRLLELAEYTVNGTLTVRVPSENTQALLRAMATQNRNLARPVPATPAPISWCRSLNHAVRRASAAMAPWWNSAALMIASPSAR